MLGRLRFAQDDKGKGWWCVDELAPHVAIPFKRIFQKVKAELDTLLIADNDDTRADLEWFLLRYPLQTSEWDRLEEGADRVRDRALEMMKVLGEDWRPPTRKGLKLKYPPYIYQEQAAEIALRYKAQLLVDDVGLGKTETALLGAIRGAPLPMAIVVDTNLKRQWARRVEKFTHLRVHVIRSTAPYPLPPADIYIFSWGMTVGWVQVFTKGYFKSVVWDEIQELRHGTDSLKGNASMVLSQNAEFRQGLTATPIYNYGDEIWNIMSYIQPDLLGEKAEFVREWCGGSKGVKDPDALGSYLQSTGYFLRRREDDPNVDKCLPPPNIIDIELDYDQAALAKEEDILRTLATAVLRGSFEESGQAARELDVKMRHITGVVKARPVAAYVDMLLRDCEKVVLGGWHRDVYDIWMKLLAQYNPVMFTGSESQLEKQRSVDRFVEGDSRLFVISLRAGRGLDGLQYTSCRDVVSGELDWSPTVHKQLLGRVRRPGVTGQVTGHFPHVNGGSDPILMQLLGRKGDQARGIMDPGLAPAARFTDDSRIKALARFVLEQ